MKMNNKCFGIIGLNCVNSNWNGDFTGSPRKQNGEFVASPFAIKYAIKNQWNKSQKVLGFKSYEVIKKNKTKVFSLRDLKQRFIYLTGQDPTKISKEEIIPLLMSCIDVFNFGTAFAIKDKNISIQGAIQFNTGINKYEGASVERVEVLSPFRNSSKVDSEQTTIGDRAYLTEAHFFYNFTVNPHNYDVFADVIDGFEGYTREAYEQFKETSLSAVSNLNSVSKVGCENEFAMFVELKEESLANCNNINHLVAFRKEDGINVIDLELVTNELKALEDDIASIEIYYNPNTTKLENAPNANLFNINRPKKKLK